MPTIDGHAIELIREGKRRRAVCSCGGFAGPWRGKRRTAEYDGIAHEVRVMAGGR